MQITKLESQLISNNPEVFTQNINAGAEGAKSATTAENIVSQTFNNENAANNFNSANLLDIGALIRDRVFAAFENGDEPVAPTQNGLSADAANLDPEGDERQVFITQYKTDDYNPGGNATGGNNCGPTSAAMALDAVGLQLSGTIQDTIDSMRDESGVADGLKMGLDDIKTAVETVEGASAERGNGWDALDAALQNGSAVVLGGDISDNWVDNFGSYSSDRSGGHFVAVLGSSTNEDGETVYTVADPLSPGGAVEMTREELAEFADPVNEEGTQTGYDSNNDGDPVDFLIISNNSADA